MEWALPILANVVLVGVAFFFGLRWGYDIGKHGPGGRRIDE